MATDPFAPELLAAFDELRRRYGDLSFPEFVKLWDAADAFMQTAIEAGYEPAEVPELLATMRAPRRKPSRGWRRRQSTTTRK